MSAKLLVATAVMAAGSFLFVDTADAQRRGGAERGGNNNVEAGQRRRGGARQNRASRNAQTTQTQRQANRQANRQSNRQTNRQANRSGRTAQRNANTNRAARDFDRGPRRFAQPNYYKRKWRQARRWAARRWNARPYFRDRGCTAVARRANGNGRVIRGIYGEGYGRRACRKALNRCENRLSYRQASGRNPYARCVVASR